MDIFWNFVLPPIGIDFSTVWVRVARLVVDGKTPYANADFYNPIWLAWLLSPFALLDEHMGWALFLVMALVGYFIAYQRLTGNLLRTVLLMLSPLTWHGLINGNIDWLVMLGAVIPPWVGVWLLALKPQMSLGVLIVYVVRAFRQRRLLAIFGPLILTVVWSVSAGLYPAQFDMERLTWNCTLWPWGLLPGLAILVIALWRDDARLAWLVGPFCAPYLAPHSWVAAQVPLGGSWIVLSSACLWALGLFAQARVKTI